MAAKREYRLLVISHRGMTVRYVCTVIIFRSARYA